MLPKTISSKLLLLIVISFTIGIIDAHAISLNDVSIKNGITEYRVINQTNMTSLFVNASMIALGHSWYNLTDTGTPGLISANLTGFSEGHFIRLAINNSTGNVHFYVNNTAQQVELGTTFYPYGVNWQYIAGNITETIVGSEHLVYLSFDTPPPVGNTVVTSFTTSASILGNTVTIAPTHIRISAPSFAQIYQLGLFNYTTLIQLHNFDVPFNVYQNVDTTIPVTFTQDENPNFISLYSVKAVISNNTNFTIIQSNFVPMGDVPTTGSLAINSTVVNDVAGITPIITITNGLPPPVVSDIKLFQDNVEVQDHLVSITTPNATTTHLPNIFVRMDSQHNYKVTATVSSHLCNPTCHEEFLTFTSNTLTLSPLSICTSQDLVGDTFCYSHTRNNAFDTLNFNVTRGTNTFHLDCSFTPGNFVVTNAPKFWMNVTDTGYIFAHIPVAVFKDYYVDCYNSEHRITFVDFGQSGGSVQEWISGMNNQLGNFFGVPLGVAIVLLVGSVWTGRTASTGIIFTIATIQILVALGLFALSAPTVGLIFVMGAVGTMMGTIFRSA